VIQRSIFWFDQFQIEALPTRGRANVKTTLVLLAAYAIVGAFHSCREFYRGRKHLPELQHRHRWFMCGLTWLPTSVVFPLMSPPFGGSARIWRRENLKDSLISWLLFASIVSVGIWGF
jgi:hypothetical protein